MRLSLRARLAVAQVALIAALGLAVAILASGATEAYLEDQVRDRLARECDLLRLAIEELSGQPLAETVERFADAAQLRVTVVAPDGGVLAESDAEASAMESHVGRPEIVAARAHGIGSAARRSPTTGIRTMYVATSGGPGEPTIRLALSLAEVRRATRSVRGATFLGVLLATLLAAAIAVWSVRALTGSLEDLVEVARRLGRGDLSARAWVGSADETRELGEALNTMAGELSAAMEELSSAAARLEAVLSQIADGVLVVDHDESIALINPRAGELLGLDSAAAQGRLLSEAVPRHELVDLARRAARLGTALSEGPSTVGVSQRSVASVATPLMGPDGTVDGVVITLRDLTEVQHLLGVRQEFVANASHELRTPVTAIQSLAEVLEGGAIEDPEEGRRFVGRVLENTRRLTSVLDDMLTLSQLDEMPGGAAPRGSRPVKDLMSAAAARLEPLAGRKGIRLSCEPSEGLHALCSEQQILAALVNLVDNAVKFTPDGGSVTLQAAREGDGWVRITVTDTGPGIPERARERIFERFYRLDRGRSRELGGTGLGLSIVKHAVEQSGGRVWVESAPGGGARFVVLLPEATG